MNAPIDASNNGGDFLTIVAIISVNGKVLAHLGPLDKVWQL